MIMDKICGKIASFPPNASRDFVHSSLGPLIDEEIANLTIQVLSNNRQSNYSSTSTCNGNDNGDREDDVENVDDIDGVNNVHGGGGGDSDDNDNEDGEVLVSPLMVACDKGQVACMEYFMDLLEAEIETETDVGAEARSKYRSLSVLEGLIGRPLDASPDHRNQAVHFAVMSQSPPEMVIHLATIHGIYNCKYNRNRNDNHNDLNLNRSDRSMDKGMNSQDQEQEQEEYSFRQKQQRQPSFQNLLTILSQRNSHGDTACMMASFLGRSNMLEMWLDALCSLAQQEGIPSDRCFVQIRTMLRMTSEGGDSCLSLASGHGHVDIVNCLIKERNHWGRGGNMDMKMKLGGSASGGYDVITNASTDTPNTNTDATEALVLVTHGDIEKIKGVMDRTKALSSLLQEKNKNQNKNEQGQGVEEQESHTRIRRREHVLQDKLQSIRRCLVMLQISMAKLADKRSAELLQSAVNVPNNINNNNNNNNNSNSSNKKKKKKRVKRRKNARGAASDRIITDDDTPKHSSTSSIESNVIDIDIDIDSIPPHMSSEPLLSTPVFKTLDDGTIVSSTSTNQRPRMFENEYERIRTQEEDCITSNTKRQYRIQSMLRDRCMQSTKSDGTTNHDNDDDGNYGEDESLRRAKLEAVMESLCLDASMLLLSPHGMAMELSPSQLDVIEDVLHQQLGAVAEARQIHHRLMSQMSQMKTESKIMKQSKN